MKNTNNNLLASIAVFAELCNTEKDLNSILKEFTRSIFEFEKVQSLNVTEATNLLRKHFDFELPEAVVKTGLNRLKKDNFLDRYEGKYHKKNKEEDIREFSERLELKKRSQKRIEESLIKYYEAFIDREIDIGERKKLIKEFIYYLIDNGVSEKYSAIISSFVLKNSGSDEFVGELNQIKEGLVLVTGLGYTDDLGKIGSWKDELTFYLDTEHLFNSEGYNGSLYHELFDDFFKLVNEVNSESRKKEGQDLIHLKYFEEVKEEIDRFFYVAEKIVQGKQNLSPDNTAMEEICKGCKSVADVIRKKSEFETHLKTMGITLAENIPYLEDEKYNIVDANLLRKYSEDKYNFEEEDILRTLRSFSKINYLRKGKNRVRFEKCGYIILTGKYLTRHLSWDLEVKNQKKDIPFATDIHFVTNRLWYTLNKGFSKSNSVPATLDIVSKAQLALTSLRNRSLERKFSNLKKELKKGKINRKSAQEFYYGLREKAKKPEEITSNNIRESLDLIFDNNVEKYLREKSSLEKEIKAKDSNIEELKKYKYQEEKRKRTPIKRKTKVIYYSFWILLLVSYVGLVGFFGYLFSLISNQMDTKRVLIDVGVSLLPFISSVVPFYKYRNQINKFIRLLSFKYYKNKLKELLQK